MTKPATQSVEDALSLAAQLQSTLSGFAQLTPPDVMQTLGRAAENLARSSIQNGFLQEGARAPDFMLPNVDGRDVRLADVLARGPVVLSFYRGGWCPFCSLELQAWQKALPELRELGGELIAISPELPDRSVDTVKSQSLGYYVLSDIGNRVARRYGLVYAVAPEVRPIYRAWGIDIPGANGDDSWELPVPGTFLLGGDGRVELAYADTDYTKRLEPAAVLERLRRTR